MVLKVFLYRQIQNMTKYIFDTIFMTKCAYCTIDMTKCTSGTIFIFIFTIFDDI